MIEAMLPTIRALVFLTLLASAAAAAADQQPIDNVVRNRRHDRPRRLRVGGIDNIETIGKSPLNVETISDLEDIAETESFFRRLGSSVSMSMSNSNDGRTSDMSNDAIVPTEKPSEVAGSNGDDEETNEDTGNKPSDVPVPAPTTFTDTPTTKQKCNLDSDKRRDALFTEISAISPQANLSDSSTAHGAATKWILEGDPMELCPDDEGLVQRYAAAVLYYATDGNGWRECFSNDGNCGEGESSYSGKKQWLSGSSECDWAGLQCNLIGEITTIELHDNNLGGAVPMEVGAFLVASTIELHGNTIQGEMPASVCDNIVPLGELSVLSSDCGGEDPLIECPCCTRCY